MIPYAKVTTERFHTLLILARALVYLGFAMAMLIVMGLVAAMFMSAMNMAGPLALAFIHVVIGLFILSGLIACLVAIEDNTRRLCENAER